MARQCLEYHPVMAFRYVPGLRARIPHEAGGYLMRVNSEGFRSDRDFEPARQGSSRRVLVFGDSFTAGDGVSNGKRYSDLLEAIVPETEVYNYGLPGSGTDQQYLAWREFARPVEHDVLVIAVLVENLFRNLSRYREFLDDAGRLVVFAKPYFTVDAGGRLSLHHVPPDPSPMLTENLSPEARAGLVRGGRLEWLRRLVRRLGLHQFVQKLTRFQPVVEYGSRSSPGWRLMRAILTQWVREHGDPARVIIMPLPLYQHVEGISSARAYRARFSELCAELGCTLHDPLPDMMRYSQSERRAFRFTNDAHLTVEGHAAVARSLAPTIMSVLSRAAYGKPESGKINR